MTKEIEIPEGYVARIDGNKVIIELAESEGERIRKAIRLILIATEDDQRDFYSTHNITRKECTAWLEKQKEHQPNIELIQRSWYLEGYRDREFGKEPKWIIKTGEGGPKHELNPKYGQPLAEEQKPAEWSEEDETAFGDLMWCIEQARKSAKDENDMGNIWFAENWLKKKLSSLRLQSHWKPSEEQMEALESAVKLYKDTHFEIHHEKIVSLYEQLKKLM